MRIECLNFLLLSLNFEHNPFSFSFVKAKRFTGSLSSLITGVKFSYFFVDIISKRWRLLSLRLVGLHKCQQGTVLYRLSYLYFASIKYSTNNWVVQQLLQNHWMWEVDFHGTDTNPLRIKIPDMRFFVRLETVSLQQVIARTVVQNFNCATTSTGNCCRPCNK